MGQPYGKNAGRKNDIAKVEGGRNQRRSRQIFCDQIG